MGFGEFFLKFICCILIYETILLGLAFILQSYYRKKVKKELDSLEQLFTDLQSKDKKTWN